MSGTDKTPMKPQPSVTLRWFLKQNAADGGTRYFSEDSLIRRPEETHATIIRRVDELFSINNVNRSNDENNGQNNN